MTNRGPKPGAVRKRTNLCRFALVKCPLCGRMISPVLVDLHVDGSTCVPKQSARHSSRRPDESHFCCNTANSTYTWSTSARCACAAGTDFWQSVKLRGWRESGTHTVVLHARLGLSAAEPDLASVTRVPANCCSARLTVSVLKSALQKNVRRGRPMPAVRVAVALMRKTSFSELLRRVAIVCVEDAHACLTRFPALTWLTAAVSRGYEPRLADVQLVLETIEIMCLVHVKDSEAVTAVDGEDMNEGELAACGHLDDDLLALVRSLQMRACYGGLKGDVRMLRSAGRVWSKRFLGAPDLWRSRVVQSCARAKARAPPSVALTSLAHGSVLRKGDVPLAAIDFQCSSICEDIARSVASSNEDSLAFRRFGRDCLGGIERLMWTFWSSKSSKTTSWPDAASCAGQQPDGPPGFDRLLWETELEPVAKRFARAALRKAGL
jgi:hypothetical protein